MRITSRLAALAAGSSLLVTGLVAAPAGAAADPTPVDQGVAWLTKQSFFNAGARIDFQQQLELLGRSALAAEQVSKIKDGAAAYATSAEAAAKLVYSGDLAKQDANTWGAGDLIDKVADGVDDNTGRIEGSYATPASQALAVRALSSLGGRTESGEYPRARDFLLDQQCADGRFRDVLAVPTCDADGSAGSADATAFVVLYLGDSADSALTAKIAKAKAWLKSVQLGNGSWKSADQSWGPGEENANSTGLAALAVGASKEATKAAAWLRQLQARDAGTCTSSIATADRGAIAFTAADYKAGTEEGLDEGQFTRGSWVFATQQSVAALAWAPANAGALTLSGPASYVRAGTAQALRVSNVAPYSRACLTGSNVKLNWEADASGSSSRVVRVPVAGGNYPYAVADSAGRTASYVIKALGAKKFTVKKSKKKAKRKSYVRITVRGLAAREQVKVFYKGKKIRTAKATATGGYTTRFKVGRSTGTKKIRFVGEFPDIRKGTTTVRVVR